MIDFLRLLIQRCRAELANGQEVSPGSSVDNVDNNQTTTELKRSLSTLLLAESALSKVALCRQFPNHPKQVVVVGPTQVGKSSTVNWLLNMQLAEASATAGFTVHCQGYSTAEADGDINWLQHYFSGLELREQSQLDRDCLGEYSYTELSQLPASINTQNSTGLPYAGAVIWDTPDFDSIDSFGYREPVLQAIALADLVVFVVSKEKYADKTVWDMLAMLGQLAKPVMLVMNKTPEAVRVELTESVRSKYQRLAVSNAGEIPVLFIDEFSDGASGAAGSSDVLVLQSAIAKQLSRAEPAMLKSCSDEFISANWAGWTAPVADEHRIQLEWKAKVDEVTADLVSRYQSEYLDHARHKETFQLALAELLALLEVPGLAVPLSKIRSVVTWPMRKLIATARQPQSDKDRVTDDRSDERRLLEELAEHGLTRLAAELADNKSYSVQWLRAGEKLAVQKAPVLKGYYTGLDNYQVLLQVEIERAAQSLYKNLQDQPATLNSLRAARVTGDAAAVVLAVKSGGLGAADLVIAPAMLSLTSMLTEGALGKYMQKVQSELRAYQRKQVAALIGKKLRVKLYSMMDGVVSGSPISQKQLQQATDQLGVKPVRQADKATDQKPQSSTGNHHV